MKRYSFILIIAVLFLSSCNSKKQQNSTSGSLSTDTIVYPVKIITLQKQKIITNISYTATLKAFEEVNYAPASPGRIEEIYVEIGSRVAKGDVIARMDKTQLIQANEQLQNALSNFNRMDTLYKLNSISKQQYELAKTQYEVAKANVDFLTRNTTLVAPISGVITGKYFENGELYSGAPVASGKAAIVTIMQINPLKAILNLSERYYPIIKKGMKAKIKVDIFPEKEFNAEIYKIYPIISPETKTFSVEFIVNNPQEILRPGMFATVSIDLGEIETYVIPSVAAVRQEGTNNYYVFVAKEDNTVAKMPILIGGRFDDKLEIMSDNIKDGDKIIIAGQEKLNQGSKIKIVQ